MEMEKLTYNISEASAVLGISRPSLYQAIKRGEIPVIRIGHRVLIPKAALNTRLANPGRVMET